MRKSIIFVLFLLSSVASFAQIYRGDINEDGKVNVADVAALVDELKQGNHSRLDANLWYVNLENDKVAAYMNEVEYDDDDYTYSLIEDYLVENDFSYQYPRGVVLEWGEPADALEVSEDAGFSSASRYSLSDSKSFVVYNLIPGRRYYWRAKNGKRVIRQSHFNTLGEVRMIRTEQITNVRDLGGKAAAGGKRIAYGKLFRGGTPYRLTDNDRSIFVDSLGIGAVVDLQVAHEETTSEFFGESVKYIAFTGQNINRLIYPGISNYGKTYIASVKQILTYLREGRPVYFHCGGGADRTGAIAFLIEGMLGCSESDISKDYELTSFSKWGVRKRINGVVYDTNTYDYAKTVNYFKNLSGATFQEKVIGYLIKWGMSESEVMELQALLLE